MMYRVRHTTTYAYTNAVSVSHNVLHLTPRECPHQHCSMHELLIYPKPAFVNQSEDYFGNPVTFFGLQEPHEALTMTANSTVDVTPLPGHNRTRPTLGSGAGAVAAGPQPRGAGCLSICLRFALRADQSGCDRRSRTVFFAWPAVARSRVRLHA